MLASQPEIEERQTMDPPLVLDRVLQVKNMPWPSIGMTSSLAATALPGRSHYAWRGSSFVAQWHLC